MGYMAHAPGIRSWHVHFVCPLLHLRSYLHIVADMDSIGLTRPAAETRRYQVKSFTVRHLERLTVDMDRSHRAALSLTAFQSLSLQSYRKDVELTQKETEVKVKEAKWQKERKSLFETAKITRDENLRLTEEIETMKAHIDWADKRIKEVVRRCLRFQDEAAEFRDRAAMYAGQAHENL